MEWNSLAVSKEEVNISTVLACGQSFRWKLTGTKESVASDESKKVAEWIGVFEHHLWILRQSNADDADVIQYKVLGRNTQAVPDALDVISLEKLLIGYFQLEISLPELYKTWAAKDPKFAKLTAKDFQGIRMLAQDPIENLFSFICSSNNNIQRISQMVEKMCIFYGEKIADYEGKTYYDFPPVERLVGEKVEKKLREESFGYRAGYIAKTAEKIIENGGAEWVENLKNLEYDKARLELQTLSGIGRKVADCICLMSLGFPEAIPVDTHIHQVAKVYLPHLAKVKSLTDKVYTEIVDYFKSIYGEYAGWAHSVLFASTLRHLQVPDKSPNSDGSKKLATADGSEDIAKKTVTKKQKLKESQPALPAKPKQRKRKSAETEVSIIPERTGTRKSKRVAK